MTMTSQLARPAQQSISILRACYLTLMLLILGAFLLHQLIPPDKPLTAATKALFVFPELFLFPEIHERTIFFALIALLLPLNWLVLKAVNLCQKAQTPFLNNPTMQKAVVFAVPVLLMGVVSWDELLQLMTGGVKTYWLPACLTFLLAVVVGLSALTLRPVRTQAKPTSARSLSLGLTALSIVAILLSVLSFRLQSVAMVSYEGKWMASFEAVFYTVSQVIAGKTLLADLPAQYGLYAELLRPIFKIVPLSVFSFTALMCFFHILGMLSLLWISEKTIKNQVLKLFAVISLCLVVGQTWTLRMTFIGVHYPLDEVYQYWPIRFFFPALSLSALYFVQKREQRYRDIALMAAFAGLAILWNLDSGIPVFGAFIAYLMLPLVFPADDNRLLPLKKIALAIAVTAFSIGLFMLYLQLKAGQTIPWQDWTKYQRIFYQSGFGMLPIPTNTIHPWMALIALYVFVITTTLYQRIQKNAAPQWDSLFFIAILGLGLFPYYQGRSHSLVFSAVMWPAILLTFILTDRTLRAIRSRLLPTVFISTLLPGLLLGMMLTGVFVHSLPFLLSVARQHSQILSFPPKTPVTENIAFIRHYAHDVKEAVIYSELQSVYFAETGLKSAVNGPGQGETILVADLKKFFDTVHQKPVKYLFIQENKLPPDYAKLEKSYQFKAKSAAGMVLLVPVTH